MVLILLALCCWVAEGSLHVVEGGGREGSLSNEGGWAVDGGKNLTVGTRL